MKILYISIGSFWNCACMKNYQHHDLLFKYINRIEPSEVVIGVPVQGPSYLKSLLSSGNVNRLQKIWRDDINFNVSADLQLLNSSCDCMVINGSENFQDIELPNSTILNGDEISKLVIDTAAEMLAKNKPVVLFDQDNYINEKLGSDDKSKNLAFCLFNKFKSDKNFYLTGPFKYGNRMESSKELYNEYVFIPFVVDPEEACKPINISDKSYITKYAGNNYHRDNFIDYFVECSKYGNVLVNGSGWKQVSRNIKNNENLEFKPKFPLTYEKVVPYYQDALLGLYGTTNIPSFRDYGHFTLRIREFYQAGIPIIVEDLEYLDDLFLFKDSERSVASQVKRIVGINKQEYYESIVEHQRELICNKFSAIKYAKILYNLLKGEN